MTSPVITGTGVDIEEIERFRRKPFAENERFYRKLFTRKEIDYCNSMRDPYPHFTARFCAKEALAKSLPVSKRPGWTEVEVKPDENGKPCFQFSIQDKNKQDFLVSHCFSLTLSHDKSKAIAFVIVSA